MVKISIITIAYNNYNGLKKTVDSVINQTAIDSIEYIIIDGASSDGTREYLEKLPDKVKWISEKDRGISHAFNKGLKLASGEMILCLNSGDCLIDKNVIESVLKDIDKKKVDILSYKVKVTNDTFIPATDDQRAIWEFCEEPHQGTFVSKRVYDLIGGYSEEYKIRMDHHFFARCKAKGFSFCFIPEIIVEYEPGGVSMAQENRKKFWREGMSVKMLYNIPISLKDMVKFFVYR